MKPRARRSTAAGLVVLALVTGCSTTVVGSGAGVVTATSTPEPTAESTAEPSPRPLPTVDEHAPADYCADPFPGALGEPMLATVVHTPSGRLTCDQAAAVLVDYYAQRRDPTTDRPPLVIGTMTCDQVPEPALPQVVCADEDNLIYSMWPQT